MVIDEMHRQHFPAVGKHFPGHGGVASDSHQALPVDQRDWTTLWRQDLRPFVALIPSAGRDHAGAYCFFRHGSSASQFFAILVTRGLAAST